MAERAAIDQPWKTPVKLDPNVNRTAFQQWSPSTSADGLQLYFESEFGGLGMGDVWVSTRKTRWAMFCSV